MKDEDRKSLLRDLIHVQLANASINQGAPITREHCLRMIDNAKMVLTIMIEKDLV